MKNKIVFKRPYSLIGYQRKRVEYVLRQLPLDLSARDPRFNQDLLVFPKFYCSTDQRSLKDIIELEPIFKNIQEFRTSYQFSGGPFRYYPERGLFDTLKEPYYSISFQDDYFKLQLEITLGGDRRHNYFFNFHISRDKLLGPDGQPFGSEVKE